LSIKIIAEDDENFEIYEEIPIADNINNKKVSTLKDIK